MRLSPRNTLVPLSAVCLLAAGIGCSRALYHQKADRDAYAAIAGKSEMLPGEIALREGGSIEPSPASRFFDPFDPDHPPMPPDDPIAHALMLKVDGRVGSATWNQKGESAVVKSEAWRELLPKSADGSVQLNLKSAVRLGLCNSRDFQKEREDLYLSALDVTFERYQLSPKFALSETVKAEADAKYQGGVSSRAVPQQHLDVLTDGSVRWLASSGAEVLASFANAFVWDFKSSTVTDSAGTLLNLSLVQPLLRLGGKDRALEALTQTERTLLANVRQMQQFQLGYYVRIASGRNSGEGPTRSGVVGSAGLGIIAGTPASRTGAPAASGFLGLLEETQRIQNQEANVARLRQSMDQLLAAFDAGRISSRLQVDQARLALFNSQSDLLAAKAAYQARVDAFKVDLGLPPDLPVTVQDPVLDRFNTSNPESTSLDRQLNRLQDKLRDRSRVKETKDLLEFSTALSKLEPAFTTLLAGARKDGTLLEKESATRKRQLGELSNSLSAAELGVEPSALNPQDLDTRKQLYLRRTEQNEEELNRLKERLHGYAALAEAKKYEEAREELVDIAADLSSLLLAVSLNQTATRLETATLPPVSMSESQALAIAREHRLDWMNARARLVDSWRKIGFYANALQSGLDFSAAAGMGTLNNNAVRFDGRTGFVRAGLRFDTPLSRLAERNNYRQALIDYQQARRDYMLFEDRIDQSLRNTLRIIELCQLNFELRRSAVQVAISQVDLARFRLEEPPRPGVVAQIGATTARDLVTALSDLLDAQNAFLSMRVGYNVLRLVLDFESGTMQVDADGIWMDPGAVTAERLAARAPRWSSLARVAAGSNSKSPSATQNLRLSFRQDLPSVR